jgi:protein-L-isoaspartate(D-aspartate) O-methyltransferase
MMSTVDFDKARFNMVEQQVRTWEVLDPHVLDLLSEVPREAYVPEQYRNLAYADARIPIGHGETMMPPVVEARMLQALNIQPSDQVLEIGTGSGYVTALLANAAYHVDSIEIETDLSERAARILAGQNIENVTLEVGDALQGNDNLRQHYDVIATTGSLPVMDEKLQYMLSIGGRLFVILGESPAMEAVLITRIGEDQWRHEGLFETDIDALKNAPQPQAFVF